jgi:GMP reductase
MKFLHYRDISLVPRHSSLESRSLADTTVDFLGRKFALPVIPANMRDVIDIDIAKLLCHTNHFYIFHRWFYGPENIRENIQCVKEFVREMNIKGFMVSISIGVGELWEDFIDFLSKNQRFYNVDYITIDVATADHENVKSTIKCVKDNLPNTKLIVGNVATAEACEYLIKLGVDAIKVGVGGGSICSTANKTGFHVPMFSCCLQCAPVCEKYNIPFIADGGIKEFGDIAKALTAGASMAMAGGIFAECIDSPAEIVNGYKQYRGSTSYEMKGKNLHIEGKKIEIVHSVKYLERLEEIKQALSSSISYAGGKDLSVFNLVNYITV